MPLDLAATLAARRRSTPRELLARPEDLARWLVAAGCVATSPSVGAEALEEARALREAIYRLALARSTGSELQAADREWLNRVAAQPPPAPHWEATGVAWTGLEVPALLSRIAREAIELLAGPAGAKIRRCEGESCSLLFVDTSRAGSRRWCSMASCGNRAKVASFRERQREE